MKKKWLVSIVVFILIAGIIQTGSAVFIAIADKEKEEQQTKNQIEEKDIDKNEQIKPSNPISIDKAITINKEPKKEVDISKVELSKEIEEAIKLQDNKNVEKNIKNYKKAIIEFNIPEQFREEIEHNIIEGYTIPDILTAYEFLYEKYGLLNELKELLNKQKSGGNWEQIFKEYNQSNKVFKPTDFKPGYLEDLYKNQGMSPDDIMLADRISQKGLKPFEDIISMRKEGKNWNDINEELGVINTSDSIPRIAVTSEQVKSYMKSTGLSENQVVDALVLAEKFNRDENEVLEKVKAGNKKEDIQAELYDEKYKK